MTDRSSLAEALQETREFLASEGALLLSGEARESFDRRAEALLEKALEPGEALYVGILGGTGVGKSMLIDALAGEAISGFSDKRPFTHLAVVYRHRDRERGLAKVSRFIRESDAVHDIEAVINLVLLDMPDFDSTESENREAVLRIMPELDAIVWVVSPEKYADAAFYELVRNTQKHQDSFTFVFNKADQLVDKSHSDEHSRLKEVLGDLAFRLKNEAGVAQPRLFSLSAEREFRGIHDYPALDREFQRFREFLMARRNAKEIASIKTVNLATETQQLFREVSTAIKPHDKARVLDFLEEKRSEPPAVANWRLEALEGGKDLAVGIMHYLVRNDASIAPVRWFLRLVVPRRWAGLSAGGTTVEEAFSGVAAAVSAGRRAYLESGMAQDRSELLLAFRHSGLIADSSPQHAMDRAVEDVSSSLVEMIQRRNSALNGSSARWRRGLQKLVFFLPVPVLLIKLAGLSRIEAWLDAPSLAGVFKILVAVISSLFGSEGLIGLIVLGICELFVAYWLAVRRVRKIERESEKLSQRATEHLDRTLDSIVERVREERTDHLNRMKRGLDRWNALKSSLDERPPGPPALASA